MSDDGEIDVESDEVSEMAGGNPGGKPLSLDKRAHHNALERKRRDHIKDSFTNLRDCIPAMSGEKVSRAHILNKATEYIRQMQRCSATRTLEIEDLRKKNEILEEQIHALEQAKASGSSIDNPEDLIASIAEKVQQRQNIRMQNQQKNSPKLQIESSNTDNKATNSESLSTEQQQSSSINVLANNIRTTQNLLNALAKNLPSTSSSNPQVRSLAARVLASPLRPTGTNVLPRGVVTATAVPSSFQTTTAGQMTSQSSGISNSNAGVSPSSQQQGGAQVPKQTTPSIDTNATLTMLVNSLTAEGSGTADSLLSSNPSTIAAAVAAVANDLSKPVVDGTDEGLDVDSLINKMDPTIATDMVTNDTNSTSMGDTNSDELAPPAKRVKTSNE